MDLSEDQRDRDECMVLNVASPEVSSRLVVYCSGNKTVGLADEEGDLGGHGRHG